MEDSFGKPEFSDTLGRLRWVTEQGAWTVGWLLLDDRLELGTEDDEEQATARYRDEYVWLARDHRFNDSLSTRASVVITSAERGREGTLLRSRAWPRATLDETRRFNGVDFSNDWTFIAATDLATPLAAPSRRHARRLSLHAPFGILSRSRGRIRARSDRRSADVGEPEGRDAFRCTPRTAASGRISKRSSDLRSMRQHY